MNITNWFSCKYHLKNSSMPKYFVLDENMIPHWKINLNTNEYKLFGKIKVKKDFNQILMIGISNKIESKINTCNKNSEELKINIPILKSNLQKCIRRSKIRKSVRTGNFLLDVDPNSLLRRLAIIYIEDVIIDNYFTNIIWYMVAVSKGYILSSIDKLIILNIIKNLAKSKFKEEIPKYDKIDYKTYFLEINSNILNHNYNIIWSLILRNKYGGMIGDINMINGALQIYSKKKVNKINLIIKNFDYKLNLKEKDILLESVDFHCTNIIGILLKKKKINYQDNYLIYKDCIWNNRSSITNKKIINKTDSNSLIDNIQLFELIKDDLDLISKNIIKYQLNI